MGIFLLWKTQGIASLPVALPLERYQALLEHSPFALASQAAPTAPVAVAGFAKDLVLTGAARLARGEFITLASRDQTQRFSLKSGETYNGISLVSVTWSDAVGKTKVTLKCGSEFGVVGFDEALQHSNAAASEPTTPFVNNGQAILPPGVMRPNPNPPRTPGTVVNMGNPVTPGSPSTAPVRTRIIRSAPPAP